MERKPELLGVDLGSLEQAFAKAFEAAGFDFQVCASEALASRRGGPVPDLVLVRAELSGPGTARALAALGKDTAHASVPIALLCGDTTARRFLKGFRTGVAELLPTGLPPPAYVARIRSLLHELPQRTGATSGEGDANELAQLLMHLRQTQRSGALRLNPGTREAGHAVFVQGVLRTARFGDATGEPAVDAMVAQAHAAWSFTEMGGGGGEGAGVVIDVPAKEAPRPGPPTLSAPTPASVLVVDDDPVVCRFFTAVFEKNGFSVSTARDGFAGYQAALEKRFDLVTADLKLPRLDGWGMLRLLREDHRTREVPLAFLSCDDLHRDQLAKFERTAQAFFAKDIGMDALVQQVNALLEPRLSFRRELADKRPLQVRFGALGPQWVLHELGRARASARINAKDAWATYEAYFLEGQLIHIKADSGKQQVDGPRALMAWILSRAAEGGILFGSFAAPRTLQRPLLAELEAATSALNERDRSARLGALSAAQEVEVNPGLYDLYARVAPEAWQPVAHLVCRQKVAPKDVASRVNLPAAEVQEALKDLFRRGVVSLPR